MCEFHCLGNPVNYSALLFPNANAEHKCWSNAILNYIALLMQLSNAEHKYW
jgi:hypothetical protein